MTAKTLDEHIVSTPGVLGGKPRIAGHRISVQDIMVWHELMGAARTKSPPSTTSPWPMFMPPWPITSIIGKMGMRTWNEARR